MNSFVSGGNNGVVLYSMCKNRQHFIEKYIYNIEGWSRTMKMMGFCINLSHNWRGEPGSNIHNPHKGWSLHVLIALSDFFQVVI